MLKQAVFGKEVQTAADVVLRVGKRIELLGRNPNKLEVVTKHDAGYGHTASSTSADALSQRMILRALRAEFPDANILTEEKPGNEDRRSKIVTRENTLRILHGRVSGVDPIDGTSEFKNGLYEWALSIGVMLDGEHIGGAIYAPAIRGGMLVAGELGKGVFLSENGKRPRRAYVSSRIGKEAVVYIGCDFHWLDAFKGFETAVAKQVNRMKSVGSCAVGLAAVAAGRVDALIQPAQKPWDWCAGFPLVEEAGGKVIFYHYRDKALVRLQTPDLASYDPERPNVGFFAGNPALVEWLFTMLQEKYIPQ